MVSVLCPICNANVIGEGELDLSVNLQVHMRQVHKFTDLCKLEGGARGVEGERWDRLPQEGPSPLPYPQEAIREWHQAPGNRLPGEDVPQSVLCPICGSAVRGYAADDLSYNLAWHFTRDHDIKVKLLGKG